MFRRCWTSTPTGPCARVVSRLDRDGRLPIGELVALSEASAIGVTIDRWTVPTVVIVYPRRSALFDLLSPREREVAELICSRLSQRRDCRTAVYQRRNRQGLLARRADQNEAGWSQRSHRRLARSQNRVMSDLHARRPTR